jgi:predicted amino acid dehydrogenase
LATFAFIVHPLDFEDVVRFEPKVKGKSKILVEKVIEWTPPFKLSEITGIKSKTGKEAFGYFIGCPLLPKHMLTLDIKFVLGKIIQAGKLAEELGAKIVGLGAYTSVVGDAGVTVSKNLNIAVTTGNSYTVASAIKGVKMAAEKLEIELSEATCCVVGATGSIGKVCAKILSKEVKKIIVVGRNPNSTEIFAKQLKEISSSEVEASINVKESVKKSDIVITATSSPYELVGPEDLKPGAVVCDVSRPPNVSPSVAEVREDVLIIDGGVIKVPGEDVRFNYDFGFPKNLAFACMSETMILDLEERYENFSLGRNLSIEKVEEIERLAEKHGFEVVAFRSFEKPLSEEKIEKIKNNLKKKG